MKSGSLNLLEPSGPHRASYGTALPLPLLVISVKKNSVAKFGIPLTTLMLNHVLFDITSCRLVNSYKLFESSQFLHCERQGVEVLSEISWY